jgi:hypothetical protein
MRQSQTPRPGRQLVSAYHFKTNGFNWLASLFPGADSLHRVFRLVTYMPWGPVRTWCLGNSLVSFWQLSLNPFFGILKLNSRVSPETTTHPEFTFISLRLHTVYRSLYVYHIANRKPTRYTGKIAVMSLNLSAMRCHRFKSIDSEALIGSQYRFFPELGL